MNDKKVYLVHCWGGKPVDGWYLWLKEKLEQDNIKVIAPEMPDTRTPSINKWIGKLEEVVDDLNEETYFIGHSIGCQTIMRYLESRGSIKKIGGILFVAPWLDLLPDDMDEESNNVAYEWINTSIDFNKVKLFTNNITAIFSDDDYFVSLDNEKEFKEKLNTKTITLHGKGHISADDDIYELDIIYDEMIALIKR